MSAAACVPIGRGLVALVDPEDVPATELYRWSFADTGHAIYAMTHDSTKATRKTVYMHRLLLGAAPGQEVDHRNGDTLDNRRCNIRLATRGLNETNKRKRHGFTSRFKGVSRAGPRSWVAFIGRRGRLGTFRSEEEAALVYDQAARLKYGEFATLNFPRTGERCALTGEVV